MLTKDIKYYAKQYEKEITGAAMSKPKDRQEDRRRPMVDGRRTKDDKANEFSFKINECARQA